MLQVEAQVGAVAIYGEAGSIGGVGGVHGVSSQEGGEKADQFGAAVLEGLAFDGEQRGGDAVAQIVEAGYVEVGSFAQAHSFQGLRLIGDETEVGVSCVLEQGLGGKAYGDHGVGLGQVVDAEEGLQNGSFVGALDQEAFVG